MSTSSLRRQMKNIVHNYSEAEIKVREATSNDPWGPSSSLMSEIADLTYNVVAFSEIMSMIWKRLNDHGKNWRHVYKVGGAAREGLRGAGAGPPRRSATQACPAPTTTDPWGGPAPTPASGDPWRPAAPAAPPVDPWGGAQAPAAGEGPTADPWGNAEGGAPAGAPPAPDPWAPAPAFSDPWGGSPAKPSTNGTAAVGFDTDPDEFSDFDRLRTALPTSGSSTGELELLAGEVPARSPGAFDMSGVGGSLAEAVGSPPAAAAPAPAAPTRKTPESFLGPNAALVDLDSLVSRPGPTPPGAKASNPFLPSGAPATGPSVTNPFQPAPPATLTLNQLRLSPVPPVPGAPPTYISPLGGGPALPPTMPPGPPAPNTNPFLL
ncbi:PREDICTED: epsin-1 [Condylura cristata]|uniref:epsin-1 n=1 Tax=Condylura cristata TaxID=143302 RepID=UPI00064341EB|nr:PREDICTED: epsin-1 [Condylura cristata]